MDFKSLKNRTSGNSLRAQLQQKQRKTDDPRILSPDWKKIADGDEFVIRFLPASKGETLAKVSKHYFKVGDRTFWEHCVYNGPNKERCPICAMASDAYKRGDTATFKMFAAQHVYYANAYIITCDYDREIEGTVRILPFKNTIFKQIKDFINSTGPYKKNLERYPEYDEDGCFDPFNPFYGADYTYNVTLRSLNGEDVPNYDGNRFGKIGTLGNFSDDVLEECFNATHDLSFFAPPEVFLPLDEYTQKYKEVLGAEDNDFKPVETKEYAPAPKFRTSSLTIEEVEEVTPTPKALQKPDKEVSDRLAKFRDLVLDD